jgi:hypothetical protein
MSFLYPQFLYGLFALAIPIIIHLFNFRKAKRVYFSSNRFLKNIKKQSSSKLRLKHLLILTARLLFIFFLVMAFAQPYFPSEDTTAENVDVYIYLDNSMSMTNMTGDNQNALETGISFIDKITDLYPSSVRYKLLTNDFAPFSNNKKSRDEIKDLLTEISISGVSRELAEAYNRLHVNEEAHGRPRDIYLISDFQKSTLGELPEFEEDTLATINLIPVKFESHSNVFVDSIYLANPFVLANEQNELHVVLRNSGRENVDDLITKLFINGAQSANTSVDIPRNGSALVTFPLSFGLENINECRISFEDFPVTFDNDFYFSINLIDKIRILEIKGSNQVTPVGRVFGNERLFNLMSYNANNLDYNLIENSDLVVLNEMSSINASIADALSEFLNAGGNILIVPARNPDIDSYRQLSPMLALNEAPELQKQTLVAPDFNNPFYQNIFEETSDRFDMPQATNTVSWRSQSGNLLHFANGSPYLSVFSGTGDIYLLGSPLNDEFTNLHRHAIFVPLMYRISALSKEINENLYYSLNEPTLAINVDSVSRNMIYRLRESNGDNEIIPAQMVSGKKLILEMPNYILNSGFYSLTLDAETKKALAFNHDKRESLLEQFNIDELKNAFSNNRNIKIFEISGLNDFGKQLDASFQGIPLWRILLLLALLFLLAEVLLIRFL